MKRNLDFFITTKSRKIEKNETKGKKEIKSEMKSVINEYKNELKQNETNKSEIEMKTPQKQTYLPLAEKQRPMKLEEIVGQEHILGKNTPFNAMIRNDNIQSTIIYGPPGVGKTTIAKIIENSTKNHFVSLSATTAKKEDFKKVIEEAKKRKKFGQNTVLFVDEIHVLNKLQQDTFLPSIENGTIILIGATTENPSFELNNALMSRCQLITLNKLQETDIVKILRNAIDCQYNMNELDLDEEALYFLAILSNGDARNALKFLEKIFANFKLMNKQKLQTIMRENGGIDIEFEEMKRKGEIRVMTMNGKIISIIHNKKKEEKEMKEVKEEKKKTISIDIDEIISLMDEEEEKSNIENNINNINILNDNNNDCDNKMEEEIENEININQEKSLQLDENETETQVINEDDKNEIKEEKKISIIDIDDDDEVENNNENNENEIKEEEIEKKIEGIPKKYLITKVLIEQFLQKNQYMDKQSEEHHNIMNAFHKSITHSDEEASMYWLEKLIQINENPKFITRRMIRIASEDIGLADINALNLAVKTFQIVSIIGYPECNTALYECALYLARAPKSTVILETMKRTEQVIKETGSLPVPHHIRNAPTDLMSKMGYGDGYKYPPNYNEVLDQTYLPTQLVGTKLVYHDKFVPIINKDDIIMKRDRSNDVVIHEKDESHQSSNSGVKSFIPSKK